MKFIISKNQRNRAKKISTGGCPFKNFYAIMLRGIVRRSEFFEFGGLIGLRGNTRQRRETKIGPGYATQLEKVAIISLCTFTDLFLIDTVFLTS